MKRFIALGSQLYIEEQDGGDQDFAWYCTVKDRFETFSDNQTWDNWDDFEKDLRRDFKCLGETEEYTEKKVSRYKALYPKGRP